MYIYRAEEIHDIDDAAVQDGLSLETLMENAGRGLFEKIKPLLQAKCKILILSGKGNNGGDGIVLARYLKQNGYDVTLTFPLGEPSTLTAQHHLHIFKKQEFTVHAWGKIYDSQSNGGQYDLVIDCLLGVGTKLPLKDNLASVISWCNELTAPLKIAVDLPTGVAANHGKVGHAFQADYTFCLHGLKPSAFLLPASQYYGKVEVVHIGIKQTSHIRVVKEANVRTTFPYRDASGHKGTFGTSLLIAGSDAMPGSAMLGALGAIRSGTGKLMVATTIHAASIIAPTVPEATYLLNGLEQIASGKIPEKIVAVGIGPGIEDEEKVSLAIDQLLSVDIPVVIDAGALLVNKDWKTNRQAPVILTPHPGEFSRLTNISVKDIQANRIELAQQYATTNEVTLVLKGQHTVIAFPDGEVVINTSGNSGLAKGGSGDVLTGMIVSMLATHDSWRDAVINAVYIHGCCANRWCEQYSETSMVASDFKKLLPLVLCDIEKHV